MHRHQEFPDLSDEPGAENGFPGRWLLSLFHQAGHRYALIREYAVGSSHRPHIQKGGRYVTILLQQARIFRHVWISSDKDTHASEKESGYTSLSCRFVCT